MPLVLFVIRLVFSALISRKRKEGEGEEQRGGRKRERLNRERGGRERETRKRGRVGMRQGGGERGGETETRESERERE